MARARRLFIAFICCAAVIGGGRTIQASDSRPHPDSQGQPLYRTETTLVALNVTVLDARQHIVQGLSRSDFEVLEDGVPQELAFFGGEQVPVDLVLVLDTSASMGPRLAIVKKAAIRFLRALRPADRASVVAFGCSAQVVQTLTADRDAAEQAIAGVMAGGHTPLYTTLYVVLRQFASSSREQTEVRRPAIVVLTDGEDNASIVSGESLIDLVRQTGIAIYPISITSSRSSRQANEPRARKSKVLTDYEYALKALATESGGVAYFPDYLSDLDTVYGNVASEVATQYSMAYVPKLQPGIRIFKRLLVRVVTRAGLRPRTRQGYAVGN